MTYKFLIDNIKEIVFRIDRNGTIEYLNKSWTEMTGFDLEESKGNLLTDYIHCEDKKRYGDLYNPCKRKPLLHQWEGMNFGCF